MTNPTVRDVRGTWATNGDGDRYLKLEWVGAKGMRESVGVFETTVAALTAYLAQPKPPTPDEIAADIVDEWHSVPIERNALRRRIAEAIKTERERHDV